jgi:hypothetical protein
MTYRMSQGFGSDCQGLGAGLSPDNGQRRLTLTKVELELQECIFPDWITETRVWNVIPRAGLRYDLVTQIIICRSTCMQKEESCARTSSSKLGGWGILNIAMNLEVNKVHLCFLVVFMGCYVWCLLKFKLDLLLRKKEQD